MDEIIFEKNLHDAVTGVACSFTIEEMARRRKVK